MIGHPHRVGRAFASLAALMVLFVGIPITLMAASRSRFGAANPLTDIDPPWRWDLEGIGGGLSEPLGDDAVVNLLIRSSLIVIWLAAAVIVVTTVSEVVHMLRHRGLSAPHVRGIGWAQGVGHWVAVGLIAVLPVDSFASTVAAGGHAGPTATAQRLGLVNDTGAAVSLNTFTVANAGLGSGASGLRSVQHDPESLPHEPPRSTDVASDRSTTDEPRAADSAVHVVQRGESIYAIADGYAAGDDARTIHIAEEILDLNLGTMMGNGQRFTNPALIQPGWTLTLPGGVESPDGHADTTVSGIPDAPSVDVFDDDLTPVHHVPPIDSERDVVGHTTYVVVPGDTLSAIAGDRLGDQQHWPQIWDDNRGKNMGGGRTFDDPNLILPGWELEIPPADQEGTDSSPETFPTPPMPAPSTDQERTDAPSIDDTRDGNRPIEAPDVDASDPAPAAPAALPTAPDAGSNEAEPSTTTPGVPAAGHSAGGTTPGEAAPRAPSPIRMEHAALLAAGLLTLVGVRRRRALRSTLPHARLPTPPPEVAATERRLRTIDPGERGARIDVAVRSASHHLAETGLRIGSVRIAKDGELIVRLTGESPLAPPWTGAGATWTLPASVPIELLSDDARKVGQPCLALVTVGLDADGRDILLDLEAAGLTTVEAAAEQADNIVRAIGSGLATSLSSEVAHLLVAGLGAECLFDHPNARELGSVEAVMTTATALVGSTLAQERSLFDLRSRRTGGEMWEPAIALFAHADLALETIESDELASGRGLAVVAACAATGTSMATPNAGARLVGTADRWVLDAFGEEVTLAPVGVTIDDIADVTATLSDAARAFEAEPPAHVDLDHTVADPVEPFPHDIVVGLMGAVTITAADGTAGEFERSKTVELIAWLATHRERATRAAARTALWEMDVRDATFANVVSEARRGLGRLIQPPGEDEWLARTLNESLPLHERVITDADLIRQRVQHARLAPPARAIDALRPAVEMIRGLPFAGTSYLWPDADGITSSLVLLATTATAELAGHALSIGDTDLVFWSTGQGLKVLPGHEELIGLRMRAHARAGDLAGVRQEWESYERVIMADSWSDGEPAPKLLDLRHQLLSSPWQDVRW